MKETSRRRISVTSSLYELSTVQLKKIVGVHERGGVTPPLPTPTHPYPPLPTPFYKQTSRKIFNDDDVNGFSPPCMRARVRK
jgi:hypothetical protein